MPKIELIPLAIADFNYVTYAQKLENNKIRHYKIPISSWFGENLGENPSDSVASYFKQNKGLDVVIVENPNRPKEPTMTVANMEEAVLKSLPKIRRALRKNEIKSTFFEYDRPMTFKERKDYFAKQIPMWKFLLARAAWVFGINKSLYVLREVVPVSYLTYAYEEPDEAMAIALMQEDLKKLHDSGLILGHLSMPASMALADEIGSGYAKRVLFAFVFADIPKLLRKFNKSPLDASNKPLNELLEIKGEAYEGEIGIDITPPYEIEEVVVADQSIAQAVLKAFAETREELKEIKKRKATKK